MSAKVPKEPAGGGVPPGRYAEIPPPQPQQSLPSGEYSYILEIVMGMQTTMGKLTEAVESLKEQSKEQGKELRQVGKDVYAAKVVIGVAGFLIAAAATFLGFVMKALIDYLVRAAPK